MEKLFEIRSEFHHLNQRRIDLAVYRPIEPSERTQIAVLALHNSNYMSFPPAVELAKRGFLTAGAFLPPQHKDVEEWLADFKVLVEYMRHQPGVKKLVLMGHSQGGCMTSCYQYIAENGADRFLNQNRIIPFPEIGELPPADGLMLLDANYGFMHVLALDPAAKSLTNGYERIPELDLFNPDNGYSPLGSHYSREFQQRFQRAQIRFYRNILARAQEMYEDIKKGKGAFSDDAPFLIAGGRGGSFNNKMFLHDNTLLSHTRGAYPIIHGDGSVSTQQIHTVRLPRDTFDPTTLQASVQETVLSILKNERRFADNFGYDECSMWGVDNEFNYMSTIANVRGIHVPLLCGGNTGSHEFVQAEYNFENAASDDKEIFFVEGARHMFQPLTAAEKYPGEFGDTLAHAVSMIEAWLSEPGRFLN